jgi:hypothetical protein
VSEKEKEMGRWCMKMPVRSAETLLVVLDDDGGGGGSIQLDVFSSVKILKIHSLVQQFLGEERRAIRTHPP